MRTFLGQRDTNRQPGRFAAAVGTRKVLDARVAGAQSEIPRHPRVEPLTLQRVLEHRHSGLQCISADAPSLEALRLMAVHDIGAVLVLDAGRAVGIFSERDYARNSIRTAGFTTATLVREMMTRCEILANPTDSVQKCLSLMIDNHLLYIPVGGDSQIAMLSLDDLLYEMIAHIESVLKENELDRQISFLRGTYSC